MSSEKIECFSKDETYSRFVLGLDLAKLKELESIDQKKNYICACISIFYDSSIGVCFNATN